VEIEAHSGGAESNRSQVVEITAPLPPTDTPPPTASPTDTPEPATNTPEAAIEPTPTVTDVPTNEPDLEVLTTSDGITSSLITEPDGPVAGEPLPTAAAPKPVGSADLLAALAGILLTAVLGILLWQPAYQTASQRTRLILVAFITGMIGYLLYGIGWLRPDLWLAPGAPIFMQRLILAALVLIFGLVGNLLERRVRGETGKRA
jgi:hypothetical protein